MSSAGSAAEGLADVVAQQGAFEEGGDVFLFWQYIAAMPPRDADLATREGRAARALLCVLEPAGDDEARSMTAEWFAAMVDAQPSGG